MSLLHVALLGPDGRLGRKDSRAASSLTRRILRPRSILLLRLLCCLLPLAHHRVQGLQGAFLLW